MYVRPSSPKMTFLEQLNNCCRRLWRDESGVVLAFTVIVFLSLFVVACSVYAVGENIRQRMELQNAADAAAYSAAVVQADALSRIAAINKALAWTYVQMGRAEMNYDLDVWLQLTTETWDKDNKNLWNSLSGFCDVCGGPGQSYGRMSLTAGPHFCSEGSSGTLQDPVLVNQINPVPFATLKEMYAGSQAHWETLKPLIDGYRTDIVAMNAAEREIVQGLLGRIQVVVTNVLQMDTSPTGSTDYTYALIASDAPSYFRTLSDSPDETHFLSFFDGNASPTLLTLFGDGIDEWFNINPQGNNGGIQRWYVQGRCLTAEWERNGYGWLPNADGMCIPSVPLVWAPTTVRGSDGKHWGSDRTLYYQTEIVKPQVLISNYFGDDGAVVVGVARRLTNPLSFMVADAANPGLFAFFNPVASSGKQAFAWATAASRAGYRNGGTQGEYWTKDNAGWTESAANLSQTDWDAELIPMQRSYLVGLWEQSHWQPLFAGGQAADGGLQTLACGTVPAGDVLH